MAQHLDMAGLIDHLSQLLIENYGDQISAVYFGDVGIYPPQAFRTASGETRGAVVVLSPNYDKLDSRAPNADLRRLGIHVICMVDMTPFFEALPSEAFGERKLVALTQNLRGFMAQDAQFTLGGRVLRSEVKGVNWDWTQRGETSIRAAAIEYEVTVSLPRM